MKKIAITFLSLIVLVVLLLVTGCGLPQAIFKMDTGNGAAPLKVSFTNGTVVKADSKIVFDWDFGDGKTQTGTKITDSISHEYTRTGIYTVTLTEYASDAPAKTIVISQNVTVTHGTLTKINIIPERVELNIDQSKTFNSEAFDDYGNPITDAAFSWRPGNAGTVSADGTFTAGTVAGNFTDGIYAVADLNGASVNTAASILIKPDPLDSATLDPISIAAGDSKQLVVAYKDKYGNKLTNLDTSWSMEDSKAGTITGDGLFTASRQALSYDKAIKVTVKQGDKTVEATTQVAITPAALTQLAIAPAQIDLGKGMSQQFVAVGADKYGNRISNVNYTWSSQDTAGSITSNGLFTASNNVNDYKEAVTVTAKNGNDEINKSAEVTINGDSILFISDRSDTTNKVYKIYSMDVDGNNIKANDFSLEGDIGTFDASLDGRRIIYSDFTFDKNDNYTNDYTWLSNVDGTWPMSIVSGANVYMPSLSPDGKKIVYMSRKPASVNPDDWDIYVMDVDGSNAIDLTKNSNYDGYPSWSPDGKHIVFVSTLYSSQYAPLVCVMNADGSNCHQVGTNAGADYVPRWSPDGQYIAFQSMDFMSGKYSICVMNANGNNRQTVTGTDYDAEFPYWSPDSSKLVFSCLKDGNQFDIYSINRDGTNLTRITDSTADEYWPVWLMPKQGVEVNTSSVDINEDFNQPVMTAQEISNMVKAAIVRIESVPPDGTDYGSGFAIRSNGVILTANHVIAGASSITVYLPDGTSLAGTVLARDTIHDLALVKVQTSDLPVIQIGSLSGVETGQQVVVLGYPLGNKNVSVTSGLVSTIEFDDGLNTTWVQTDSAVNPGNSGGPLLDMYGKVIGLITRKIFGIGIEGMGYAISADTLNLYVDKLLEEAGIS